ncbi:hypothetical protein ABTL01_20350, partial [Acinetobacter baumannii]
MLLQPSGARWLGISTNLEAEAAAALRGWLNAQMPEDGVIELAGERLRAHFVPLIDGEQHLGVLLLRSLDVA